MVWIPIDTFISTAYRRVVPLYSFDDRNRPYLSASAVPFQSGGLHFLITAAHCCFQDGKPLPLFVYGEERPHALTELRGAWEYRPGRQPDLDVAVIALAPDCADDLQKCHWFCSPDDVALSYQKPQEFITSSPATQLPGIENVLLNTGCPAEQQR